MGTDQQAAGRGGGSGGGTTGLTIAFVAVLTIIALAVVFFVIFHDKDPNDQKIADGIKLTKAEARGQGLFGETCASCHTLAASHSAGTVGPNLDQLKPPEARVQKQVINGGAVMPAFKGTLTPAQITAVAKYVSQATKSGSR